LETDNDVEKVIRTQQKSMGETKVTTLTKKLRLKDFKLNSLLEITRAINNNYSVDKLLEIFEYILREQLGISKLMLFNKNKEWRLLLKYGVRGGVQKVNVAEDLIKIRDITVIESSSKDYLSSFDVVIPVFHKDMPLAYLLIGDLDEEELKISPGIKHMPFIQTLTNIIVVAIENKRLAKDIILQERAKKELELAAEMQSLLFPSELPSNHLIDVAAGYLPHQQVGGDYYDFITVNDTEFVMCMADVSGKGVSAALLMSNFQAVLRATLEHTDYPLEVLVEKLNDKVMSSANGEKFITFFIAQYNIETRKLKYVNAGHNHPVLTNGKTVTMLNKGSTGLGMFDKLPFVDSDEVDVEPNSTLICYTDGIVELENEAGEAYEIQRLIDTIHENYLVNMTMLNEIIFEKLVEFKEGENYIDDTAILSCRFF